ncbi:MAG TPA: SIMPL domain-containing protein [Candidatus Paceibacterota bacterium]|nr:SIMPL domain-containing protein [Candidatus Paceibacterota bacterium]
MKNTFFDRPYVAAGIVLGLAFIVGLLVLGTSVRQLRGSENTISVTGSAKERVSSDIGKFSGSWSRQTTRASTASGYTDLAVDMGKVTTYLKSQGATDEEIAVDPSSSFTEYDYDERGNRIPGSERIVLRQNITVTSKDLPKIKKIADNAAEIVKRGVSFEANQAQYLYSSEKLSTIRVSLMSKAITDAKNRADAIAEATGASVRKLANASSGVVQLLRPDSVDVEDYGSYDTSTIEKDVMITVRANFELR